MRSSIRLYSFLTALFLGVCLLCFHTQSVDAAVDEAQLSNSFTDDQGAAWRFVDDSMGKRFRYQKDGQRIAGRYEVKGDSLLLDYVNPLPMDTQIIKRETVDTIMIVGDDFEPPKIIRNTLIDTVLTQKAPIPTAFKLSGGADKMEIRAGNEAISLSAVPVSTMSKVTNNRFFRGILGICFLLFFCYLLSNNRSAIDWRLVAAGLGLQIVFAFAILYVPPVEMFFEFISGFFVAILRYTEAGSQFLFGNLVTLSAPNKLHLRFSSTAYHCFLLGTIFCFVLLRYSAKGGFRLSESHEFYHVFKWCGKPCRRRQCIYRTN